MSLGTTLQRLRKARGERQEDIARACGVHTNTYARIERDEFAEIGTNVLIGLAQHFACTTDELLGLSTLPANGHSLKDARAHVGEEEC